MAVKMRRRNVMKQPLTMIAAKLLAAAALIVGAPLAFAGGHPDVSWSVTLGSPYPQRVYGPPPVVYVEPEPVYVQPRTVYVRPAPVYVYGGPVVHYSQPYYVEEVRYEKFRHRHWNHHDHGDRGRHGNRGHRD
jgi:hypothetical protein